MLTTEAEVQRCNAALQRVLFLVAVEIEPMTEEEQVVFLRVLAAFTDGLRACDGDELQDFIRAYMKELNR